MRPFAGHHLDASIRDCCPGLLSLSEDSFFEKISSDSDNFTPSIHTEHSCTQLRVSQTLGLWLFYLSITGYTKHCMKALQSKPNFSVPSMCMPQCTLCFSHAPRCQRRVFLYSGRNRFVSGNTDSFLIPCSQVVWVSSCLVPKLVHYRFFIHPIHPCGFFIRQSCVCVWVRLLLLGAML